MAGGDGSKAPEGWWIHQRIGGYTRGSRIPRGSANKFWCGKAQKYCIFCQISFALQMVLGMTMVKTARGHRRQSAPPRPNPAPGRGRRKLQKDQQRVKGSSRREIGSCRKEIRRNIANPVGWKLSSRSLPRRVPARKCCPLALLSLSLSLSVSQQLS